MIEQQSYGSIPTNLDLNGPILSFTQNPVGIATVNNGSARFIGIATAVFPSQSPTNSASNSGYISYRWYEVGIGALTDGTNTVGSATTTLLLTNLKTPTDNGRRFYLTADYVDSGIGTPTSSPGVKRNTGTPNAINEPISSSIASATVYSLLSITSQPQNVIVARNNPASFSVTATTTDSNQENISYQWELNNTPLSDASNISGSRTNNLSISLPNAATNNVRCLVSNSFSSNSPIYSNSAILQTVIPRSILNIEKYQRSSSIARLESVDLSQVSSYTVVRADLSTMFAFYAAERDLTLEVELFGPSGANYGSFLGGEGGYSKIRFTAKKNEEYTVAGLDAGLPPFLYRKAALIACVGEGGDAYYAGNGGAGGGISVSGGNGSGSNAGAGGQVISVGSLTLNGIYGSLTTATDIRTGDSKASVPNGGRTIACTRGNYWNTVGYAPCDDLGNIQFRMESGLLVTNSAVISRGHKFGYSIRNTAGAGSNGGNGGDGATGGNGGYNGAGGGGGSGYTDGSVTVLDSRLGGNIGVGKVVIRIAP